MSDPKKSKKPMLQFLNQAGLIGLGKGFIKMKLSRNDLKQISNDTIDHLASDQVDALSSLSKLLLADLKEALDKLNQNQKNSSRPSSSMDPWDKNGVHDDEKDSIENHGLNQDEDGVADKDGNASHSVTLIEPLSDSLDTDAQDKNSLTDQKNAQGSTEQVQKKRPGKQRGAEGFGRQWSPDATEEPIHCEPTECVVCTQFLNPNNNTPYSGYTQIDVRFGDDIKPGMVVTVTPFILHANTCSCGHENRYEPKADSISDEVWEGTQLSEWRWIGPTLASFIAHLKMDFRLPIRKIIGILHYFGIYLSIGTVQKCYEESGAVVASLEEPLIEALLTEALMHADETTWIENANTVWLWVFLSSTITYYCVGRRTKRFLESVLRKNFRGWLMTDGYCAYRHYEKRLRCWAHLLRKATGLAESTDATAIVFGQLVLELMNTCMKAIYAWRGALHPAEKTDLLIVALQPLLETFKQACERYGAHEIFHEKTRALAREFLNDWDAIFRILEHPYLPLTNNDAERALRPWVLLRKICYGSRSAKGTKTFTLLASVIDTCRKRSVNSMQFLADAILAARKGLPIRMIPSAL